MQTDLPETHLSASKAATDGRPRSSRYEQMRELILQKAAHKFNMLGVRGATLADVAAEVNLNLTSIRHYFKRKEDLVAAGFLRSIEVHTARTTLSMKAGGREARVRDFVHRYFQFRRRVRLGEEREVMIFGDLRSLAEPHASEVWPKFVDMFRAVRGIVADPEEMEDDRRRVNARTHTLISQLMRSVFWLGDYPVEEFDRVESRFVEILIHGLASPASDFSRRVVHLPEEAPPDKRSWESFLLAATHLINEQGYRGASVERIAARLNVTKGSFYHHIEAKGDLVVACFNRNFSLLQEAQRLAAAQETKGLHQAIAAASALVRRQQTPAGPLLRNSALMSVDPGTREKMLGQMDQIVVRFTDMVSDGIVDGSGRPCDPRIAGQMLMAMVNSAGELKAWVKDISADNAVDLYVTPLMKGLFA